MIETIKSYQGIKLLLSLVMFIYSVNIANSQTGCCDGNCTYITDAIMDPDNQCLLLNNLGEGINLDATNNFYSWSKDMDTRPLPDTMFIRGVGRKKLRGLRRTYVSPVPYTIPQIGDKKALKEVWLAKYYYYNWPDERYWTDINKRDLEGTLTQNDWFPIESRSINTARSTPGKSLKLQLDNITAHTLTAYAACTPELILPWDDELLSFTPPATYQSVGVRFPNSVVFTPPELNGQAGIEWSPNDGITAVTYRVMSVSTTGIVTTLTTVNALPRVITRFNYTINDGDVLWIELDPSMYTPILDVAGNPVPDAAGRPTFSNPIGGRKIGEIVPPSSNPRKPDTICFFGTEEPVVGEDVTEDGLIILR